MRISETEREREKRREKVRKSLKEIEIENINYRRFSSFAS
jgi:hypothetical protein